MIGILYDAANEARGAAVTTSPLPAPGYSAADLTDGLLGRRWRGGVSALNTTFTLVLPATFSPRTIDFISLHDIRAISTIGAVPWRVRAILTVAGSAPGPEVVTFDLERGSAFLRPVPVTTSSSVTVTVIVSTDFAAPLEVGEICVGELTEVHPHFREVDVSDDPVVVANGSFRTMIAPPRMVWDMTWPPMREDVLGPLLAAADHSLRPVVFVPDTEGALALHGHLDSPDSYSRDVNRFVHRRLTFTESRRGL